MQKFSNFEALSKMTKNIRVLFIGEKRFLQHLDLMLELGTWVLFKEYFINSHIKRRNHFLWITHKLSVQVGIKCLQVATVNVQERCLQYMNLKVRSSVSVIFL